jgi:serine/threonine protein kinase
MSPTAPPLLRELGRYEVIDKIAEGGMGAVFKARLKTGGPVVAVKVLPAETARNATLMKRFEQEFRAAALIDHPNVVKAIEYCGAPPTPFLVMEYVDGCTVGERVDRHGPFTEAEAVHIIGQVCEGLHGAHKQGLIHRDVKPDNVLLTADLTAKLTDLGLVRDVESDDNLTRTGKGLGTPHYMAPEQFRNAKHVDARSDVYSLGATLYMMVTGKVPFGSCSPLDCWMRKTRDEFPAPKALAPHLSDRIDFAIRRAMRATPADRPTNCREFMEDLTGGGWKPRSGATPSGMHATLPADTKWYMVYYADGVARTVKGTTATIRRNIQAGTLGDLSAVLVSRAKAGPFAPMKGVAEFRDLVLGGSTFGELPVPSASRIRAGLSRSATDTPPPSARLSPPTAERTDALVEVPLTTPSTMNMGTDERPTLSTRMEHPPLLVPARLPRRYVWWAVIAIGLALILGLLAGLALR